LPTCALIINNSAIYAGLLVFLEDVR